VHTTHSTYPAFAKKKKKGIEPLDNRVLTVFSSLFGIESGARFEMLVPWLQTVLHPSVVGAIPGLALDIAWDAQADQERAMSKGIDAVLSSYDYSKFANSFDSTFHYETSQSKPAAHP